MFSEFYKLNGLPFQLTPDPRFYFDTRTHKKAMAYLTYGLSQGEGFIIITGDIGAGKTTLVGHLFDSLDKSKYVFAKVVTTQLDADNLLKSVAHAFGIGTDGLDKAGILRRIEDFLRLQHRENRRCLLIIDEVQNLPIAALEELRMLSNFQHGNTALLQTFLTGQPEFRDKLALSPELEQLRQRVIATHHLEPMQKEELPGYIFHRLRLVGWNNDPEFTQEAFDLMYDYSGGVPRRLNNLCSRVMLFGSLEEAHVIDARIVEEVVNDLKRDQTPTTGPKHISSVAGAAGPVSVQTLKANVPPRMMETEGLPPLTDPDLARRVELLERYVRAHDQTIRQTLMLLSEWAEATADSTPKRTGTDDS